MFTVISFLKSTTLRCYPDALTIKW